MEAEKRGRDTGQRIVSAAARLWRHSPRPPLAVIALAALLMAPGAAFADTCKAYGAASRGYADVLEALDKEHYKFGSTEYCREYRKAQAFAKQAYKNANGCKSSGAAVVMSSSLWKNRFPPHDIICE